MKFSEAMLKGYQKVGGRQCRDHYYVGGSNKNPQAVCVNGAISLARCGVAEPNDISPLKHRLQNWDSAFVGAWGIHPQELNDDNKLPWEHIYGMAVAAGL